MRCWVSKSVSSVLGELLAFRGQIIESWFRSLSRVTLFMASTWRESFGGTSRYISVTHLINCNEDTKAMISSIC
jgi:hypothetical protein